jgi:pimeloyl-ACP methyl ester carboxylesterase
MQTNSPTTWIKLPSLNPTASEPIVLLHGWGHSAASVRPLGELLRVCGTVYVIELPGFGGIPRPIGTWGTEDYADSLIKALQEEGVTQAIYLGHSFGGKIALSAAIRHPHHVHALGLMAPSGVRPPRSLKERTRSKLLAWTSKALRQFDTACKTALHQNYFAPRFGSTDYRNAGDMRDILVRTVQDDLTPHLKKITHPTLLLWGKEDRDAHFKSGLKMASLMPSARLIALPQKEHLFNQDVGAHLCAHHFIPFISSLKGASS